MSPGEPYKSASADSGVSLLVEWANKQDHWVRALAAEVIETRKPLSDVRVGYFLELLLLEKELTEGDPVNVPQLSAGSANAGKRLPLSLVTLRHVENVNALAPNQEIEFNPRLTLLFGENASGKTGYVRILKRAAAVRTAEAILPNIREPKKVGPPKATISFSLAGSEQSLEWSGEQGVHPLTQADVFDARAAVVHVEDDLTYAYTPADLALFPLVHDGIERVGQKLERERAERVPKGNPYLERFSRQSRLYSKIESLGPSTDLRELEALAEVSPQEESILPGLREKVDALKSGVVQAHLQVAINEEDLYKRLAELAAALRRFDRSDYNQALDRLGEAEEAHARTRSHAFASENIPGVLGTTWQNFVEAAEAYIRDQGLDQYPEVGAPCVYCRQPLGETAVVLLRKYRDYCNDVLRKSVDEARQELQTITSGIANIALDELERQVEKSAEASAKLSQTSPLVDKARAVLAEFKLIKKAIKESVPCEGLGINLEEAEDLFRGHSGEAKKAVDDLKKQVEDRQRALADETARLRDLEDRITLRKLIPPIKHQVEAARWADRAKTHLSRFQVIKKGLTETSKRASLEILNRDFQRYFESECEALGAPRVSLDFPGRGGEAKRRKLLTPDHGLEEILSEGEQKVIALADFLAEAALKQDKSPIILDDPVTSLDHKRLQHVVDRLVALSQEHQVIVFTHDIWFAAELLARFEKEPSACTFYDVISEDGRVGCVCRGSHPRTDTYNDRARRITQVIEEARKTSGETRQALVEKGYELLRGACEIVVEKDVLRGVCERYRPNVRMTVLDQIRADRLPAVVQSIQPLFERCCRIIASHSQPLSTLGVRPTLEQLESDWSALKMARGEYLK